MFAGIYFTLDDAWQSTKYHGDRHIVIGTSWGGLNALKNTFAPIAQCSAPSWNLDQLLSALRFVP
jgi:hypothetical protein